VISAFDATTLKASSGTILAANGQALGTGSIFLAASSLLPVTVSGSNQYQVNGAGSLSFYGPAESSLGVSGNWNNYSANVTGNASITLTVPDRALTLNGKVLPAGTYTITTNSATLSGSGNTTSANFAGSASITATNGTVNLGAGSGNITLGGKSLDVSSGATLDGYTGSITVAAGGGNDADNVTLKGNAANVLTVSATPNTLTTDQNTPVTFKANVNTSFADTYNLIAQAPPGWTVTIDSKGNLSATPAPGLQNGTYSLQIIAQSTTNPNLVAQTTVNVAITPTQPGLTLKVNSDPLFTVPFNGAQVPTAFQAVIHNTGPIADTYNLAFSNVPAGFTVLNSGTSLTIPAGQTGTLGIYLQPTGSQLPAPGTQVSFNVTATSTTNSAITQTQDVLFTMPPINAVNVSDDPTQVNTLPGLGGTTTLTLQNVGNESENEAVLVTSTPGLTVTGLSSPVSLGIGASATQTLTLTPDANTPLNSILQATVEIGPAATKNTVAVVNVNPSTSFVQAGQPVSISADVLNGVTQTKQAQAFFTVTNSAGKVVFTSKPASLTLSVLTNVASVNLGSLDTSGLASGQYTIQVSIADSSGKPIAGATGTGSLVIGAPVTASLTVSSDVLSPTDPNSVTNTLTVESPTGAKSNQSVTATVTVPTSGVAAVVPNSFSVLPNQVIAGNGSETLVWNLTLAPGASTQITWQTTLNGLAAGQVVAVATGATIQVGSQKFTLPGSNVAGIPETQTLEIPVKVVAPGVPAISNAAVAAHQIGNTNLANQLNDLSTALTNLVQNPTSAVYNSQAVAAITSIVSQVTNDPFLAPFASGLTAGSTAISRATTVTAVQTAVTNLGTALNAFSQAITDEAAHGFTLSLSPSVAVVEPSAPETFDILLTNKGTAATTYDLSVSGLPSGVKAAFSQGKVTLQPGQSITSGNNAVTLTLTESGATLVPASFTVTAVAEGAPETTLGTPGQLTLRQESILVAGVTTNPAFTNAGGKVAVSAQIQDVVNEPKQVMASYTVTDSNGKSTPLPRTPRP
jgi:uncharacterized membrane protein